MRARTMPQKPVVSALSIGLPEDDSSRLAQIFAGMGWQLARTATLGGARTVMATTPVNVVVCERELPDGGWQEILDVLLLCCDPPALIVTSRLADELLWAEVINMGGYDVLVKPLDEEEVTRVMGAASRHFDGERRRRSAPLMLAAAS